MESLGSVGAVVPPFVVPEGKDVERASFCWLEAQLLALIGVMERGCKFVALFCIEVSFNLLETLACQHVRSLADLNTTIGSDSRDGASEVVNRATRRVLTDYWVALRRETARQDSITHVSGVSNLSTTSPFSPWLRRSFQQDSEPTEESTEEEEEDGEEEETEEGAREADPPAHDGHQAEPSLATTGSGEEVD